MTRVYTNELNYCQRFRDEKASYCVDFDFHNIGGIIGGIMRPEWR